MTNESWPARRQLAVAWAALFINFGIPFYGAGVINSYMSSDLGLDQKSIGLGFTLFLLISGLPAPAVAWLINRVGVRAVLAAGSGLVALGAALMATVVRTGLAAACIFGVLIGAGVISGGLLSAQTLVARWFERGGSRAMAILLTAMGTAGFLAPPLLNVVITKNATWRAGWWAVCACSCLAALVSLLAVREPETAPAQSDAGSRPASVAPPVPTVRRSTVREATHTRAFWTLCVCAAIFTAALAFVVSHLVGYLRSEGVPGARAAIAISTLSVASLVVKFAIGALGGRLPMRIVWCGGFAAIGAGVLLMGSRQNVELIGVFATLCGLGIGVSLVALSILTLEYFGGAVFPLVMGLILTLQTMVSAFTPFASGAVYDSAGNYGPFLDVLASLCVLAIILLLLMKPPSRETAA